MGALGDPVGNGSHWPGRGEAHDGQLDLSGWGGRARWQQARGQEASPQCGRNSGNAQRGDVGMPNASPLEAASAAGSQGGEAEEDLRPLSLRKDSRACPSIRSAT